MVELMVAAAILAVLMALALPSMNRFVQRQRLLGASQLLRADLQMVRSEAVMGARILYLQLGQDGGGSCYVVHTGQKDGCRCASTGRPLCREGSQAVRQQQLRKASGQPALRGNVRHLMFSGSLATVSQTGTLELQAGAAGTLRHVVGITGRVRVCAAGPGFPGLARCA